jgi:hypothetical protein
VETALQKYISQHENLKYVFVKNAGQKYSGKISHKLLKGADMRKPPKTHLFDGDHDKKIPSWDSNKLLGYRGTICGYQRQNVRSDPREVNCILCLREMKKRNI